jgi:hypothetical protein
MELTDAQKETVADWFAAGATLDEIQKRIKSEFGIHLTYLDVRLMVAELPQPEEEAGEGAAAGTAAETAALHTGGPQHTGGSQLVATEATDGNSQESDQEIAESGESIDDAQDSNEAQTVSAPTVTIDALMLPGTIASGDVTFSDGKAGKWYLDQMGRLGIGNLPEGYRPSPTDAALFQQQLMGLLQAKGLC